MAAKSSKRSGSAGTARRVDDRAPLSAFLQYDAPGDAADADAAERPDDAAAAWTRFDDPEQDASERRPAPRVPNLSVLKQIKNFLNAPDDVVAQFPFPDDIERDGGDSVRSHGGFRVEYPFYDSETAPVDDATDDHIVPDTAFGGRPYAEGEEPGEPLSTLPIPLQNEPECADRDDYDSDDYPLDDRHSRGSKAGESRDQDSDNDELNPGDDKSDDNRADGHDGAVLLDASDLVNAPFVAVEPPQTASAPLSAGEEPTLHTPGENDNSAADYLADCPTLDQADDDDVNHVADENGNDAPVYHRNDSGNDARIGEDAAPLPQSGGDFTLTEDSQELIAPNGVETFVETACADLPPVQPESLETALSNLGGDDGTPAPPDEYEPRLRIVNAPETSAPRRRNNDEGRVPIFRRFVDLVARKTASTAPRTGQDADNLPDAPEHAADTGAEQTFVLMPDPDPVSVEFAASFYPLPEYFG